LRTERQGDTQLERRKIGKKSIREKKIKRRMVREMEQEEGKDTGE
jgi:hypothetical protein